MSRVITVKCPTCGYEWWEDLDDIPVERMIFKGEKDQTKVEEYRFRCPKDGTYFIKPVPVEE